MLRLEGIFWFLLATLPAAFSQSIPQELLAVPTRLELDKPTRQIPVGSILNYTIILKNAEDQTVVAPSALQLTVETPSGQKTVVVPAGQSSASFTWDAASSGVARMTVRSGKLHPATGLVLVVPSPRAALESPQSHGVASVEMDRAPQPGMASRPLGAPPGALGSSGNVAALFGRPNAHPQAQPEGAATVVTPPPPPPPMAKGAKAKKLKLYVEPLPVYGNATHHAWAATVTVAAMGDGDSLAAVTRDVPIHFNASAGHLSTPDIVLSAGQFSNFEHPVQLTANHSGIDNVEALSSLGPAGPVEVDYLQPQAIRLRVTVGTPELGVTGSSKANVQVCLLDESEALTASDQDNQVTLTATGQLSSPNVMIKRGADCSEPVVWTSSSGKASIRAEAVGLASDTQTRTFPSFPWYFAWLAAAGGVLGALISSSGELFSAKWWSLTWRSLVLGAVLGAIFYLFAIYGAIHLPKDSPVNIQNIPVASGVGALLLGFLGGVYGRKLWPKGQEDAQPPAPPKAHGAAGGGQGAGD